jgi:cytochrome c oxidase subunit 7
MPIAPITGKLRKRLWLDLSSAFALGISSAYGYWSVLFPFSIVKRIR